MKNDIIPRAKFSKTPGLVFGNLIIDSSLFSGSNK